MHIYCNKLSLFCRLSTQEVSDSYKTKVHQIHKKKFVLYILTTHIYRWFECWCTTFWPCRVYNETNVCHSLLFYNKAITFIKPSTFITEINLTLREALAILPSMSWALTSIRMYPDMSDWNMVLVLMIPSLDRLRGSLGNLFLRASG